MVDDRVRGGRRCCPIDGLPQRGCFRLPVALGLFEQADDGWRLSIAFNNDEERYDEIIPWFIDDSEQTAVRDVFYETAMKLVDDPTRWGDPHDPVCGCWLSLTDNGLPDLRPLLAHWGWLDPWVEIFEAILDERSMLSTVDESSRSAETVVSFGATPRQTSIQALHSTIESAG